jgi:hypothetical protein
MVQFYRYIHRHVLHTRHFQHLENMNARVFNRGGSPIGGEVNLREHYPNWYFSREFTEIGSYRVRVCPRYSYDSGSYRIAYNKTAAPPK